MPKSGPDAPHWSRLVAIAHSDRYRLFADGDTASSGLALVATNGRVSHSNPRAFSRISPF